MAQKDEMIMDIIDREWEMFQKVNNIGGRAACQENFTTFFVNRMSQAQAWSGAALESYLKDLDAAIQAGRNLLSEKYARMMAATAPEQYQKMAHLLPPLDEDTIKTAEAIVAIIMVWEAELAAQYPHIISQGRPLYTRQDTATSTSVETYLRGELLTYSLETLKHYLAHVQHQKAENINGSACILEAMMRQYGYDSLEKANTRMMPSPK